MYSSSISVEQAVQQLKEMFPVFDQDVILSVLYENDNRFEQTVNTLLSMQGEGGNEVSDSTNVEREISIFSSTENSHEMRRNRINSSSNTINGISIDSNIKSNFEENFNYNSRMWTNPYTSGKNSNKEDFQAEKKDFNVMSKNEKVKIPTNTKVKKSFGQKFKGWINNIFTNKEKKSLTKNEEYSSISQNDY